MIKNKEFGVVYSLNHKELMTSDITDWREVLSAYEDETIDYMDLSEKLMSANILEPVMLIELGSDGKVSGEQLDYINQLNGKQAVRYRRDDFEYLKALMDKPFWEAGQGMVISTNESTEIFLDKGNKVFETTPEILENNDKAKNNTYVHSFNIKSLSESFKEANDVVESGDIVDIEDVFENSDRESRIVLMSVIANKTLGLSKNSNNKDPDEAIDFFSSVNQMDEYKDYIFYFGLAATQDDKVMKDYQAIRKIESYAKQAETLRDSHPDYVENILNKDIKGLLNTLSDKTESKIIKAMDEDNVTEKPRASIKNNMSMSL